jgi:hypothetical protein
MNRQLTEKINLELMNNILETTDWQLNNLAWELYWWCDFFNMAFFKKHPVPVPVLSFEKTRINTLGHYVIGRNAFGFKENININRANLNRPFWDIMATLLHEMCHSWQNCYGNPSNSWFHNREFQLKMLDFGIVINSKGCHLGVGDPFVFLLKKHGIVFTDDIRIDGFIKVPPKPKKKGKSKLKKWECPCGQKVRVGKAEFFATCDLCKEQFALVP